MAIQVGTASFVVNSSLVAHNVKFVIGGQPVYYVTEANAPPNIFRYVTEDFNIVTNQRYYVSTLGIGGGPVFSPVTNLVANAGQLFRATAALSAASTLTAVGSKQAAVLATLSATSTLTALGNVGVVFFYTGGPFLTAFANAIRVATASLTAETVLVCDAVQEHLLAVAAQLQSEARLSAKAIRVPNVKGHSLVYIVTAPNMWELTSDPDIGPLLQDDTYISVYHTAVNSVDALTGAWRVIILFAPAPFDLDLAGSDMCPLIYDLTAISTGKGFNDIVVKNDLGDVADLEIILDGFAAMIMPGMLG